MHRWLAGKMIGKDIPERLQHKITEMQIASEKIIGWVQLAIVIALAALYALSPKAFPDGVSFEPVPWFLSGYVLFTLLRLYLSYRGKIGFTFSLLSIFVDMMLLFGLIWSFHIQYDQPPSFYLKTPTLMYVFIFISLRALRFEPGFVVFSGLTAAAGWLLMSYYAVIHSGGETITRDYVEYLTSNMILIGAEWDKVISILMVTGILATVIARGQDLLKAAVRSDAAAQDLSKFVPAEIARQIKEDQQSLDLDKTETGAATILFVDLESFTTISEALAPDQIVKTLNQYFAVAAAPIHEYGGVISQFQGDAILASFNIPRKNPEHGKNAIKASLEILKRMAATDFNGRRLRVRIGLNTGDVTGGLVGITERVYYTVHGDNVNIASRLENLNKETGTRLLIAESTMNEAPDEFNFSLVIEKNLRGKSKATRIYTVIDAETNAAVE